MIHRIRVGLLPAVLLSASFLTGCARPQGGQPTAAIGSASLNVADAAIAGGDPTMALSVTQSVLQSEPDNVDALIHEGDAYYALGRCPAAEAAYQIALQKDPSSSLAETGVGRCLLKTDPHAAEAALLLALRDDPGNAAAYNDLGIARDLQGNFAGAVEPYERALAAAPTLTAAEVNLGLSLALSGNGAAALQYLGPLATAQGATPKIREDYAAALIASGRQDDARQVLSVDLPPDQVNSAMNGFNELISNAQPALGPQEAAAPQPPTVTTLRTTSVETAPLMPEVTPEVMPEAPPAEAATVSTTVRTTAAASPASYAPAPRVPAAVAPQPSQAVASPAMTPPPPSPSQSPAPALTTASAAPPPPAPAEAPAEAGGGAYMVQLAALNSQADAQRAWARIAGAMPALFGEKQPDIKNAVVNGKTFYRLRTGGFASPAEAAKFCGEVSAAGSACTVASF